MRANVTHRQPRRCTNSYHRSGGHTRLPNRWIQGPRTIVRLFSLRLAAYLAMSALGRYRSRVSGGVESDQLRMDDVITLDIVSDDPEQLRAHLRELGWPVEWEIGPSADPAGARPSMVVYVEDTYPLELRVYPTTEADHACLRSGWSLDELEAVLSEWHAADWRRYNERKRQFFRAP